MKALEIGGTTGRSEIYVGESLSSVGNYLPASHVVIVTDRNVGRLYRKDFPAFEVVEIGAGEEIKNLDTVQDLYGKFLELGADRSSFILGVGGGVVCDIAGFTASTYLRGLPFGFVSTTLLSQVDASVGGKNGVNYKGYKNMIGLFNQPRFVLCDMALLKTLPQREVLCGFAEIVKHALIGSASLFSYLENHWERAASLDPKVVEHLVYESVVFKASVVNRDEKEKGERRKLNFGHTFGHAVEKTAGALHGEAVSVGMMIAAEFSVKKGRLSSAEAKRVRSLLQKLGLPVSLDIDRRKLIDALRKDKKKAGNQIHFVFLDGIGRAAVEAVSIEELEALAMDLHGEASHES